MDSKTVTSLVLIGGFALVALYLVQQTKKTAIRPGTGVVPGSSVYADIGAGLGGLLKGWTSKDSGGSGSGGGDYTWGGYTDNSIGTLGGDEG